MKQPHSPLLLAAVVVVSLAGCASGDIPGTPPAAGPTTPSTTGQDAAAQPSSVPREPLRYSEPVREPKDARAIQACDLLTDDQVQQLDLVSESAEQRDQGPGLQTCVWLSAIYPANSVSIQKSTEGAVPVLDGLYLTRESAFYYEEREIAGYPAVRGELSDTGTCTIAVAISDYQGVGFKADQPESDPCTTSTRMAELVLSNLPPLIEE